MAYDGVPLDLKGKRFGRLVVLGRAPIRPRDKNAMWTCRCDCGGWAVVAATNLAKSTKSCGCLARETAADLLRVNRYTLTHNLSQSLEYKSWCNMKGRCNNPNNHKYHSHGGRGIKVCERWQNSFENFYADMGKKPTRGYSIERVDNDGDYCPENCIWATIKVQGKNTRTNVYVEIGGVRLNLTDWCIELGIPKWRLTELYRPGRGKTIRSAPRCRTSEEAIRLLYAQIRGHP
jgi:hypothetical protein